jgi:hypothetical protein
MTKRNSSEEIPLNIYLLDIASLAIILDIRHTLQSLWTIQ